MAAYISFQPTDFFNTILYNGTASQQAITGVGFQPDYTWIKRRQVNWHCLVDAVRGATKRLSSNVDNAEVTDATAVESLDTDGFTVGIDSNGYTNQSGGTYVAWNWKAGTTSGLSGGTITPSAYSYSATSGFGMYYWAGTGATGTIAHGLGTAPKVMIIKSMAAANWGVYNQAIGNSNTMFLDLTNASTARTYYNSTSPTSTVFTVKDGVVNDSGSNYIGYVFAPVKGFSKFGSYTGNAQLDGPFIHTGFRPAYVMVKITDTTDGWYIWDNRRSPSGGYNAQQYRLIANESDAEGTNANYIIDMVSNGFKLRDNNVGCNGNGNSFVYMAFAEFPFVSSNSKACTAR